MSEKLLTLTILYAQEAQDRFYIKNAPYDATQIISMWNVIMRFFKNWLTEEILSTNNKTVYLTQLIWVLLHWVLNFTSLQFIG